MIRSFFRRVLSDKEGKPVSLNMKSKFANQDQYLSPVKIECEGKGDEMPTLKANHQRLGRRYFRVRME